MRTLTLVTTGFRRPGNAELRHLEREDKHPRTFLYAEMLNSDILDEAFLEQVPRFRKMIYRPLPILMRQILEAYVLRNRYDAVISWSEKHGLLFALLLKITFARVPHVALFSWISKPKKALLLKRVHSHIDRIVLWSRYQRDFAVHQLHVPPARIVLLRWFVDEKFFRPMPGTTDMICAVGSEMRDYPTLIEALRGIPVRCHIAAGTARVLRGENVPGHSFGSLPSNVTVARKNYGELRDLYARSRFVVVPILPASDTDNGVTAILEAMAMGKPVICSRVRAQMDIVEEGVTGTYVTPGDPGELRAAILDLWNDPARVARMGQEARAYVDAYHTMEGFFQAVKGSVEEAIGLRRN